MESDCSALKFPLITAVFAILATTASPALERSAEPPVGPRQHQPEPTSGDISAKDLMTRLYIVADDSMEGREAATRGGRKVEDYLAREAARLGLEPAGAAGSYFQQIPLVIRSQDTAATLSAGPSVLRAGQDFLLLPRLGLQVFRHYVACSRVDHGSPGYRAHGGHDGEDGQRRRPVS
jgi:hypothetical protein